MKTKKIAVEIICFLFILLFTYAAVSKLMIYDGYILQMRQVSLIADYAIFLAWIVPSSELVISALLAIHRFRRVGMYAATSLMVIFTAYIGIIIFTGQNEPCTCGGVLSSLGWAEHFFFNIVFVILGIVGIFFDPKSDSKDKGTDTKKLESKPNKWAGVT